MMAHEAIFTVLDFESTGAWKGFPDEPWQIGMVEMQEGRVTGRYHEGYLRVSATRPFNPYAPGPHASIRQVLASAPTIAQSWPAWRPWLENRPLVAHNASTEKKMLNSIAPMHALGPWVDTLKIARRVFLGQGSYSLGNLCSALKLVKKIKKWCPGRDWHDALFDAFASAVVLETVLALPGWEKVTVAALAHGR